MENVVNKMKFEMLVLVNVILNIQFLIVNFLVLIQYA